MRIAALLRSTIIGCIAVMAFSVACQSQVAEQKVVTLDGAKSIAAAAEKEATAHQWQMVIAILDNGGNVLYLERMDGAPLGSIQVAQQKARTAVLFKAPSKTFADGLAKGDTASLKLDILPYAGGIPLTVGGKLVGAIGVSGGTATEDNQVAQAGAEWLAQNSQK